MASYLTIEGRATAEIEEKKSRFIAHICHVETEEEAIAFIETIRSEHRMARHNVYAYILRGSGDSHRVRYSDDGEPQKTAGLPTLQVLQHEDLVDIVVVVTRYFGGTLLGTGGLVRAYTQATQAGLSAAKMVRISQCIDITINVDYPLYDQLLHLLSRHNTKTVRTDFAETVTIVIRLLAGDEDALLKALTELCHGKERVSLSQPFDAAF